MKKYNHFGKQEQRYLTTLKVAAFYAIIAALIYLISSWQDVLKYFQSLL
jgi:hypothetical protein